MIDAAKKPQNLAQLVELLAPHATRDELQTTALSMARLADSLLVGRDLNRSLLRKLKHLISDGRKKRANELITATLKAWPADLPPMSPEDFASRAEFPSLVCAAAPVNGEIETALAT